MFKFNLFKLNIDSKSNQNGMGNDFVGCAKIDGTSPSKTVHIVAPLVINLKSKPYVH